MQRCHGSPIVLRDLDVDSRVPLASSVTGWAYMVGLAKYSARRCSTNQASSTTSAGTFAEDQAGVKGICAHRTHREQRLDARANQRGSGACIVAKRFGGAVTKRWRYQSAFWRCETASRQFQFGPGSIPARWHQYSHARHICVDAGSTFERISISPPDSGLTLPRRSASIRTAALRGK
jgi:hypothetical protein